MFFKTPEGWCHISISPSYRLRTNDGRYIFMAWHHYCGPSFYKDKLETREIQDWYNDEGICEALDWFVKRGKKG